MASEALEDFPDNILSDLVNAKAGIVTTAKFMPSIAELVEWCEARQDALRPKQGPKYYQEPEREAMPPEVRARMLRRFVELQDQMAARAGRDLFQQYAATKRKPGDIIDLTSDEYRQFCEARHG